MTTRLLNDKENAAADAFAMQHYKKHEKTASIILTATATGLGYSIKVECPYCRKQKDITDHDSW